MTMISNFASLLVLPRVPALSGKYSRLPSCRVVKPANRPSFFALVCSHALWWVLQCQTSSLYLLPVRLLGLQDSTSSSVPLPLFIAAQPLNSARDLHRHYHKVFRYGNRNAASHLWSSYLFENFGPGEKIRTFDKLQELFTGFCPISGSPVSPNDYNRYGLVLPVVPELAAEQRDGLFFIEQERLGSGENRSATSSSATEIASHVEHRGSAEEPGALEKGDSTATSGLNSDTTASSTSASSRFGFLHYCCWPCVCDTQDFLRVDSKTVTLSATETQTLYFVVIGNPCERETQLDNWFFQPFDGRQTTLRREAPEVRCSNHKGHSTASASSDRSGTAAPADSTLIGATLSDHGYPIIGMFFDSTSVSGPLPQRYISAHPRIDDDFSYVQPGRPSYTSPEEQPHLGGRTLQYMNETDFDQMCAHRKAQGYNSGMGEIFRKVAEISPISLPGGVIAPRDASATNGLVGEQKGHAKYRSSTAKRKKMTYMKSTTSGLTETDEPAGSLDAIGSEILGKSTMTGSRIPAVSSGLRAESPSAGDL
ncbi:unnamed protein product [Amoebophrya sp. A25]|nr:unnamed protein product [Amoebophrya sp. A25]|eukprot:GSA25T00025121001.1